MKRRFEFRLGRVLRVREIEERGARSEWAHAEREAREAADEVERVRAGIEALRRSAAEARGQGSIGEVLVHERLLDARVEELELWITRARTLELRAEKLADAWREAESRRKALDELGERRRTEHRRAVEEQDQFEADERGVQAWRGSAGQDPEEGSSHRAPLTDEGAGPSPRPLR